MEIVATNHNRIKLLVFRKAGRRCLVFAAFPKSASKHLNTLLGIALKDKIQISISNLSEGFEHNFLEDDGPSLLYR